MKTTAGTSWILALALSFLTLPAALAQAPAKPEAKPTDQTPARTPDLPPVTTVTLNPKASPPTLPADLKLSPWTSEIVKLAQAGIEDEVMVNFIDNAGTFNLGADHVIYLSDLGLSSGVINSMLQHDQQLLSGARPVTIASDPVDDSINSVLAILRAAKAAAETNPPSIQVVKMPSEPASTAPVPAEVAKSTSPTTASTATIQPQPVAFQATKVTLPSAQTAPATSTMRKSSYPVRSAHPEDLLPPIVVIQGPIRNPQIIVIERFPEPEPTKKQ